MERRVFLTGLLGIAGAAAVAAALPREAQALTIGPLDDPTPASGGILPELQAAEETEVADEGVQVAWHRGRPHGGGGYYRRRRRRIRRWRRVCRRYRNRWGAWVNTCRRTPFWVWI